MRRAAPQAASEHFHHCAARDFPSGSATRPEAVFAQEICRPFFSRALARQPLFYSAAHHIPSAAGFCRIHDCALTRFPALGSSSGNAQPNAHTVLSHKKGRLISLRASLASARPTMRPVVKSLAVPHALKQSQGRSGLRFLFTARLWFAVVACRLKKLFHYARQSPVRKTQSRLPRRPAWLAITARLAPRRCKVSEAALWASTA